MRKGSHWPQKITYNVVVVTANRGSVALALANTNHVDGGAVETDKSLNIENDIKEVEECSDGSSSTGLFQLCEYVSSRG